MIPDVDGTHHPELLSWVDSANAPGTDFPLQNLPLGIFREQGRRTAGRVGVAIGDMVLDLAACLRHELLSGEALAAALASVGPTLNPYLALPPGLRAALRAGLSGLLREGHRAEDIQQGAGTLLHPLVSVELLLPVAIGDYTDFYASVHHATNVGSMFRPDQPLLPNYKWVPIGYHGRASSIVASGTRVPRPCGQLGGEGGAPPVYGPSRRLDYEVEVGTFVGPGNVLGTPIPLADAPAHIAGFCLVNDWSARDVQAWEYQPLGPFLSKSFATTLSPWVVTPEALAPFRVPLAPRADGDPRPLPYLQDDDDAARGGIDLRLELALSSAMMRVHGHPPCVVSRGNLRDMYWTPAQLLAHHASNGCNLRPGDLLASGTVSGPAKESRGCLLERTWRGTEPLELPSGELRRFLEDGDEVILRGRCERAGFVGIGFGECRGMVDGA